MIRAAARGSPRLTDGSARTIFKFLIIFFEHGFPLPWALQIGEPVLLAGDAEQSSRLCLHAEPAGCRLDKQAGSSA